MDLMICKIVLARWFRKDWFPSMILMACKILLAPRCQQDCFLFMVLTTCETVLNRWLQKDYFTFMIFMACKILRRLSFYRGFHAQQYRINPTIFHVEDISCSIFTSILFIKFIVFVLRSGQIHLEMIISGKYSSCRCTIVVSSFDLNNIIDLIVSFLNSLSIIYLMPLLSIF